MTEAPENLSQADRDRVEGEAALWLVRLAESPDDPALQAEFKAWRDAAPLHEEIWLRTERAYGLVAEAATQPGAGLSMQANQGEAVGAAGGHHGTGRGVLERPWSRIRRWAGRLTPTGLAGSAAVLALTVAIVAVQTPTMLIRMQADYMTATAETEIVELSDGSRIHLGPESAIEVALTDDRRRVRLLEGQAFFEVDHDPAWPFDVEAGDTTATVLGTAFDVQYEKSRTRVAVSSGRVRVADATTPTRRDLDPGDWIEVAAADVAFGEAAPDGVGTWRHGELIAYDRPISEIVDDLRPYHDGFILLRNKAFAETRVSGLYDLADADKTLRDLAASHGAVVRRISPWVTVITAD